MKFVVPLIFVSLIVIACGSNAAKDDNRDDGKRDTNKNETNASLTRGEALIKKSDCESCHKRSTLMIGPSYFSIANKYTEADIEILSDRIINGSKGVWKIKGMLEMNGHPELKREDARDMVRYILTCNQPYVD